MAAGIPHSQYTLICNTRQPSRYSTPHLPLPPRASELARGAVSHPEGLSPRANTRPWRTPPRKTSRDPDHSTILESDTLPTAVLRGSPRQRTSCRDPGGFCRALLPAL